MGVTMLWMALAVIVVVFLWWLGHPRYPAGLTRQERPSFREAEREYEREIH